MQDFTLQMYQDAGHQLKVSATGFNSEPSQPERFTAGYPQIMIQWLRQRSLITDIPPDEKTSSKGRK
jgi:hypothetical protein